MSYIKNHLMDGEEVVKEARLNRIVYLPAVILLALSVVLFAEVYRSGARSKVAMALPEAFLAMAAVAAIPAFIRRSSSEFAVTDRRVVVKVGFLRRHSTEILLRQVEGITVDQGILGRVFGYGTIIVEGTGSDRTPYKGIAAPLKFRLAVQEQIERSLARRDGGPSLPAAAPAADSYSELLKLNELREKGILTDVEFAREKRRVLERA
jgi:membrane protein YdbS with pleckstrin-like domain